MVTCCRNCSLWLLLEHKSNSGSTSNSGWVCKAIFRGKENYLVLLARLQNYFSLGVTVTFLLGWENIS